MPLADKTPDIKPGYTTRYLSQEEVGDLVNLARGHVGLLWRKGQLPAPDVWLAMYTYGWNATRVDEFFRHAGITDEHGERIRNPSDGDKKRIEELRELAASTYATTPTPFLGSTLAAAIYGKDPTALYMRRIAGRYIPAKVIVSTRGGWEERAVIDEARRARFDLSNLTDRRLLVWARNLAKYFHQDSGVLAIKEKAKEYPGGPQLPVYRMALVTGWIKQRVAERPAVGDALLEAGFDFHTQKDA